MGKNWRRVECRGPRGWYLLWWEGDTGCAREIYGRGLKAIRWPARPTGDDLIRTAQHVMGRRATAAEVSALLGLPVEA